MSKPTGKPQLRMRTTLTQFVMENQPPHSRGDFTLLMMAIQTACKIVEKNIRRAGMSGMLGYAGSGANATGDDQAKLDVISNDAFKALLIGSEKVTIMGSEEEDTAVLVQKEKHGGYVVCFDPLDGSSNIDCNVSVGSIWGIWKLSPTQEINTLEEATRALLRPGNELVSAGYAMYASATNLVMSTGVSVDGFTLDATIGEFVLTHPNMKIRPRREIYSVNEGNARYWHDWFLNYIDHIKYKAKKPYSARYIGSMVADVHRTIMYGGVFCYPNDKKNPNGKLRFLYEAAPIAYLIEHAGGLALTDKGRILDVTPTKLHQRVPVFLGSKEEIELLMSFKNGKKDAPPAAEKPASKL
jgi:fructose-1,6-bisphosphatase I